MTIFEGAGVAIVTPFQNDAVDLDTYQKLIDRQIDLGIDAIITCGTTGEPSTMSYDERMSVIKCAIDHVAGRVPVIASTGGNNTREVIRASREAQALGADGLLVVTPYYNKATQAGLIAHYTAVADAVDIPIVIYNVPGRTGLNVTPETLKTLSKHPNIQAMKEASGNISQVSEMARLCGEDIDLYSGEDGLVLPIMSLGGKGVISVVANVMPKETHDLCAAALAGDYAKARALQFRLNPLIAKLFCEVNPIPVKTALAAMGLCSDELRLPLCAMGEENKQKLLAAMREAGVQF